MRSLFIFGFISLAIFSHPIFATDQETIICNSVLIDKELPPDSALLKGYLRVHLKPELTAEMKPTGQDEETTTTDIQIKALTRDQLADDLPKTLMQQIGVDAAKVDSATMYTVTGGGHGEMLLLFLDKEGKELGRGGILDLFALFRCVK